jgi:hypothetical protein
MLTARLKRFAVLLGASVLLLLATTALLLYTGAKDAAVVLFDVTFVVGVVGSAVWSAMAIRERFRSKR